MDHIDKNIPPTPPTVIVQYAQNEEDVHSKNVNGEQTMTGDITEFEKKNIKEVQDYLNSINNICKMFETSQESESTLALDTNLEAYVERRSHSIDMTTHETSIRFRCEECKAKANMHMRKLIPIPYAIFGSISLLLTTIFGTLLGIFLFTPFTIMNPWINLVYFIGSFGLLITVVAAIKERRSGKL